MSNKNNETNATKKIQYTLKFDEASQSAHGGSKIVRTRQGGTFFNFSKSSGVHYTVGSNVKVSYRMNGDELVVVPEKFSYAITDIVNPVKLLLTNNGWNFMMGDAWTKFLVRSGVVLLIFSIILFFVASFIFYVDAEGLTVFLTKGFIH
jgi:hypothetical protein